MYYIKRGFFSIVRKPTKTNILFLVIVIVGMLMSDAVSIKKAFNTNI